MRKRTAIFTLRFKMLTARTPELSAPKFLLAQNGVRFGKEVGIAIDLGSCRPKSDNFKLKLLT